MTYHNAAVLLADTATAVVERAPLTRAFEIVNNAVEGRNSIPVLSNALLRGDGTHLIITGTDLDMTLQVAVPAAADHRFNVTLPAARMRELLKKATPSDFVAFSMPGIEHVPETPKRNAHDAYTGPAVIDFERVKYKLQAIHPDDFPKLAGPSPVDMATEKPNDAYRSYRLTGAEFWRAIDGTIAAVSTEETRYYLNGIYMHAPTINGASELRFVATDGHRLYLQSMPKPAGLADFPGVIIPRKTAALLHKLLKGKACPETVDIDFTDTRIRFSWFDDNREVVLTSKLVDGTFPDYPRVMPALDWAERDGRLHTASFDPEEMLEAVRAVSLISSQRGRAVKVSFEGAYCRLSVDNPEAGSASADVACGFTGGDYFESGYNAGYLVDIITTASPGGTTVKWAGTDYGAPCQFTGDRAGWIGVLMPMRV